MKKWLTGMASAFVEFDEETPEGEGEGEGEEETETVAKAKPRPRPVAAASASVAPAVPSAVAGDTSLVTHLDASTKKQLLDSIETASTELVDELMDLMSTLRDSIPSEAALYAAALKILVKKGHSLEDIARDFATLNGALEATDAQFVASLDGERTRRVGSRQTKIDECRAAMEEKNAQIAQLQQEISDLGVTTHETTQEMAEEEGKLQLAQARFTMGYNRLHAEFEAHSAKVTQYGATL